MTIIRKKVFRHLSPLGQFICCKADTPSQMLQNRLPCLGQLDPRFDQRGRDSEWTLIPLGDSIPVNATAGKASFNTEPTGTHDIAGDPID